jgi:glycosyltransferase involved in cell wall biosynthesis
MQIRWRGPCWGQSGYEELTRGLVIALDKLGVTVQLETANDWNMERIELDEEDVDRLQRMERQQVPDDAVFVCHQRPKEIIPWAAAQVCYSLFETDRMPGGWVHDMNLMDQIWTFSDFNLQGWKGSFIRNNHDADKIRKIPFGIDCNVFRPDVAPVEIGNRKLFAFLSVGDFTERKNFEGLIEAYVKEFTADDDVCLIMKVHYEGFVRRYHDKVMSQLRGIANRFNQENVPRILFFGDKVPAHEMPSLYRAADCFAIATRGEGLGIPMIESMACGVPCIATDWGAQTDYITEDNGYLVDCDVRVIDDSNYIKKCLDALNHSWAYPSIGDLRKKLRAAYESRDELKKKGERARKDMIERTWQNAGIAMIKNLLEAGV